MKNSHKTLTYAINIFFIAFSCIVIKNKKVILWEKNHPSIPNNFFLSMKRVKKMEEMREFKILKILVLIFFYQSLI